MALSSQNLPCKTEQQSVCLTQNALFPLYSRKSRLPIEFSLLPATCKRSLVVSNSNLHSDKVAERDQKKTINKETKNSNKPIWWRPYTAYFLRSPQFGLVYHHPSVQWLFEQPFLPLDFQFLSLAMQKFTIPSLRFPNPLSSLQYVVQWIGYAFKWSYLPLSNS